ncbi:MAG: LytR C-terminal domain-containing protein, partial [Cyanobacteria bacterium P01_A01_bin.135]
GDRYYASYWVPDPGDVERIMQDYFEVDPPRFSSEVTGRMRLAPEAMADSDPLTEAKRSLRIAVQSASEQPYVAQQMAQHLRERGFEQVYIVPDWPTAQAQTQIIAQRGDTRQAGILEETIGLGMVIASSTGDLTSDITIRVGQDWSARLDI